MGKYDFKLDMYDENTITWIANRVEKGSYVLEFGSANGRLTRYLSVDKGCCVDIVEIDEESGREAAQYADKAFLGEKHGDIEKYEWIEIGKKYDYVIFADVLEHLVHAQDVLDRCKTVLKENGKVLVSVPNVSHNSVIIDLMNDKFHYNPTGIMDNTHVRFFTRQSFADMAQQIGLTIVEEKAKYIRVGETEIQNSYTDVSKEVFKELIARPQGNIYQYMFVLALNTDLIRGKCERIVSLDSTSYYKSEIQFEHDGIFDYSKSVSRQINPHIKNVQINLQILSGSNRALFLPLNCNCVMDIVSIKIKNDGEFRECMDFKHNGILISNTYYFVKEMPMLEIPLQEGDKELLAEIIVYSYDVDDKIVYDLYSALLHEQQHIRQIVDDNGILIKNINSDIEGKNAEIEHLKLLLTEQESLNHQLKMKFDKLTKENEDNSNFLRHVYRKLPLPNRWKNKIHGWLKRTYKQAQGQADNIIISVHGQNDEMNRVTYPVKKVSAVIPNYNYERFLDERIDSVLCQTYPVSEIIILDDCSSDNSVALIRKRIEENKSGIPMRLAQNQKNSGSVFSQWQKAFSEAKGDYIWIAEADDSSNCRFLETVMKGFDDKDVVLSYCESLTMDENNVLLMGDLRVWIDLFNTGKWEQDYIKNGVDEVAESMCINNTIANVSSTVIRMDDYYDILEEAKKFHLAGDWYVYMNILKRGKIAYFKESLNYHRMQTQGLTLSTSHEKEFEEIVKLQDFALDNFNVLPETKEIVMERRRRERKRFGL